MEKLLSATFGAVTLTLLYGTVRLWFHAIERWRRGEIIVPFEPRRPVPWGLIDLLLIFLLVIALVAGAQRAVIDWWHVEPASDVAEWTTEQFAAIALAGSLATLVASIVSLVLVQLRTAATLQDLGLVAAKFWSDVKLGGAAFVMLAPPMFLLQIALVQLWEYEHTVQDLLEQQPDLTMLLVTLTMAVGVAPFAEEIFFRVLLQGWLENVSAFARKAWRLTMGGPQEGESDLVRDWHAVAMGDPTGDVLSTGPTVLADQAAADGFSSCHTTDRANFFPGYVPIVLSATLFALMHVGQGPAPIPLFFLSLGLGYLYRQTHRATPAIVVHLLINSVSMLMMWIGLVFKE